MAEPQRLRSFPDWAALHSELLVEIAKRAAHSLDYLSFRSVCRTWRSAAPLRKFPPLLMFPYDPNTDCIAFFDPAADSVREFPVPEAAATAYLGASQGWLALINANAEIFLLNPFTHERVFLPPASMELAQVSNRSVSRVCGQLIYHSWDGTLWPVKLDIMRWVFLREIVLSAAPNSGKDCVALAILAASNRVAYCRPGDKKWTIVRSGLFHVIATAAFFHGKFYVADYLELSVVDVKRQSRIDGLDFLPLPETLGGFRLVEWNGDLLYVATVTIYEQGERNRLNLSEGTYMFRFEPCSAFLPRWELVEDLGENMVFLSQFFSSTLIGSKLVGCKPNSIYVASPNPSVQTIWKPIHHYRVVHVKEDKVEEVSCHWITRPYQLIQWIEPDVQWPATAEA